MPKIKIKTGGKHKFIKAPCKVKITEPTSDRKQYFGVDISKVDKSELAKVIETESAKMGKPVMIAQAGLNPQGLTDGNGNAVWGVDKQKCNWNYAGEYGTTGEELSQDIKNTADTINKVFTDATGRSAVVTYTTNGTHSPGSKHYTGNAIDLRTRDLATYQSEEIVRTLKNNLSRDYDIIFESDHIHIEYDPK
ncbi:MAG: hypothetical protein ABH886_04090 [Candidatus Desantisbacteria bacterium]